MQKKYIIAILIILVGAIALIHATPTAGSQEAEPVACEQVATTTPEVIATSTLSHQQEVWISALEWCESRGINEAINEVDLDGTSSYYAFQFKPGTFRHYGELYGVIEKGKTHAEIMVLLKQYDLQRSIVEHMVEDPGVRWETQFPHCVRTLGRPPIN